MKRQFTIGIVDDVTNLSLPEARSRPNTAAEGTIECKFWGLGGDGTVGANKNSIKIIGDHTDKYVQAYFQYDSKKTGGVTISHLRFGDKPIKSPYYINKADFVACHNPSYITKGFKMVNDVKPGGVFMINCQWDCRGAGASSAMRAAKRYIAKNNIQLYTINAIDLAIKIGMGKRTNTILQSAFFTLAKDHAAGRRHSVYEGMRPQKSYLKKGQDVVDMNHKRHRRRRHGLQQGRCPRRLGQRRATPSDEAARAASPSSGQAWSRRSSSPSDKMDGDSLPVSAFMDHVDGQFELGASAYEKRGVAVTVPDMGSAQSASSATSALMSARTRRSVPFALTEEEAKNAPAAAKIVPVKAGKGKGVYSVHHGHLPAGLHGLRRLHRRLPGQCADHGPAGDPSSPQQDVFDYAVSERVREEGHAGQHRQGQPVQAAHA